MSVLDKRVIFFVVVFIATSFLSAFAIVDEPKEQKIEPIQIKIEQNIFNKTFEKKFDTGVIKDIKLIGAHIGYFLGTRRNGGEKHQEIDNNLPLVGLSGHLRDGTFFKFSYLPSYSRVGYEKPRHRIFEYYLRKNINEHNDVSIGQIRTPNGVEGSTSVFYLPTGRRSLIAKTFSNITAIGARFRGDYDKFAYDAGIFDSGRLLKDNFNHPPEFAGMVFYKPIENTEKYGKLKLGAGYNGGKKVYSYGVYTAYAAYDYKKWHADYEYAFADGYSAYVNSPNKGYGYYTTLRYDINPKWDVFTRFQELDANKKALFDSVRQYSVGVNYFIRGEKLRLTLSYVYTDYDSAPDANQLFFSTKVML